MFSSQFLFSLFRQYPGLVILGIVLGFSGALFNGVSTTLIIPVLLNFLGQPMALGKGLPPIVQTILAPFQGKSDGSVLLVMTGVILMMIILKNVANYGNALVSGILRRKISQDLRAQGMLLLLEVDIDYYVKTGIGDIINRLGNEISRVGTATTTIVRTITVAITALVFLGLLLAMSWQLTIVSTVLLGLVALINQYSIARSKVYGKQLSESSKAYSVNVLDTLTGMRLIRTTANESAEYLRIEGLIHDREQAEFQSQTNSALIEPVSEVAGMIALLLIVFVGRTFLADQVTALSTVLLTYLFLLFRTLPLVAYLNSARSQFANSAPSIDIVRDFLQRNNKPFMDNGSRHYTALQEGIHFNHLSLAYPGQKPYVLKDIDLYLPRGTTLALVGSSGAGKSTLADLLPRFYDPSEGCILIDGIDLKEFDFRTLRRSMGIVSQDTFLFNASIRRNIAYGCPHATDEEVITAAKQANAYEFILSLPQGMDTQIGDRGVLLSGGQRQRLAIARALLQNPEILILDEATSALDTVSERLVQEAIDNLSRNRTTLVIAHRLSTVQKADQIAVMEKGRVVELGTHQELLQQQGYYARLCEMQFGEQTTANTTINRSHVAKISYDIRTRLNTLVGSLGLMIHDVIDHPEERQIWTKEAYHSALSLIHHLEVIEQEANAVSKPNLAIR